MLPGSALPRLRRHYFAIYGVYGCLAPYMSVYFRTEKNLTPSQMGLIFATGQTAVLFMPALVTLLADRYRMVRPLLLVLFATSVAAMTSLAWAAGFAACLALYYLNQLASNPQLSLGDGLFFSLRGEPNAPPISFPSVRVWGTLGYIAPSLVVFAASFWRDTLWLVPLVAAGFALFGFINALGLPHRLSPHREAARRWPTLDAARVLARPPVALFCLGVGCIAFSNTAFYGFYPLYLTQEVGIGARWIGPISTLGVGLEVFYLLILDRLQARLGFGGLFALGGAALLIRAVCLAFLPTPLFAIGLQLVHGLIVIGFIIAPVLYLNTLAGDGFRNSIQGLYVMIVSGVFAITGNLVSGALAGLGLPVLYRVALAVAGLGLALIAWSFALRRREPDRIGQRSG